MTDRDAIKIVIQSAEANASGHQYCNQIHDAIDRVKKLLEVILKPKRPAK